MRKGPIYSTNCSGAECVGTEVLLANESGGLYAPHVIEPWIQAHEDKSVDVFWNVSIWNPYQVVLMKSTLREP